LLRNNAGDTSFTDVSCTLVAGRARDTSKTWLNPETGKRFRPYKTVPFLLTHTFARRGTIELRCFVQPESNGHGAASASQVELVATSVGRLFAD
jgi:hypothetical protein